MTGKNKKKTTKATKRTSRCDAQDLLDDAKEILQGVDDAEIFQMFNKRQYASFERSELQFGELLGVGGYCFVREIRQINLKEKEQEQAEPLEEGSFLDQARTNETEAFHYDASTARGHMAKFCIRNGDARYAVKQLQPSLTEVEKARGMIDLAVEVKFLSVVSHPNIIKMRSTAAVSPLNESYFLVLDRLYGTLDEKLEEWRNVKKMYSGCIMKFGADKESLLQLDIERLLVAYDLAAAYRYLHENKLVYRDIKSDNIGFDIRGDVKIFDFGLCRALDPKLKLKGKNGLYKLTGLTGSFPYMAPEVALCKPYSTSADVFSFGMLLWEMFALKLPFQGFTRKEYFDAIATNGMRPRVRSSWPGICCQIIKDAWNKDPLERPDFHRICNMLRTEVAVLNDSAEVINRTTHMMNRSRHSFKDKSNRGSSSRELSVKQNAQKAATLVAIGELDC